MTRDQILHLDYINFSNQKLIENCEQILIELLKKEIYTSSEICFLNTYISSKFAHQEKIELHVRNIGYQNYIEHFQAKSLSKKIKATKDYYEIMAQSKKIKEEDQKRYIHTFHIDSYTYRNSRAYTLIIIFHELRHIIQNKSEKINSKIIKYEDYIGYYEELIINHDYEFYEKNHERFYKEKDANIFAIIKTLEILTKNDQKLNILDKTVLNYQTKKIFARNTLQDRMIISEKAKEIIEKYANNISIWKVYELEFNETFENWNRKLQRKTINQILKEIKQEQENSKYYTYQKYYTIDEKLFDYLVINAIYNDNNLNIHLQTLNKEERKILIESLKRSEKNMMKYQIIIENQLKQNNISSKEWINIILDQQKRTNYFQILSKELNTSMPFITSQKVHFNKIKTKIMK